MHFDNIEITKNISKFENLELFRGKKNLLVEKLFQALSPLLYKLIIKYPVIASEGELPDQSFSREWWDHHLQQGIEKKNQKTKWISC